MKTIELPGGKVSFFYGPQEMPADVHHKLQKYLIQASGMGSHINDVTQHLSKLFQLLAGGHYAEAGTEVYNLYQGIFYGLNEIDIESTAFACFVANINGEALPDYSEETLRSTITRLSKMGMTQGHVWELLADLKKNFVPNYSYLSLESFPTAS